MARNPYYSKYKPYRNIIVAVSAIIGIFTGYGVSFYIPGDYTFVLSTIIGTITWVIMMQVGILITKKIYC